jgi:hypothetical protein
MSQWQNYNNKKQTQPYVTCTTAGCDGWTWQSRWISQCKKCSAPFDWSRVSGGTEQQQPSKQPSGQGQGSSSWSSTDDPWAQAQQSKAQGNSKQWGNRTSSPGASYQQRASPAQQQQSHPDTDALTALKQEWEGFEKLFGEVDHDELPTGMLPLLHSLKQRLNPDPPAATPDMLFKKLKGEALWARQEYLKAQAKAQQHSKKVAEYQQWLYDEKCKLQVALDELEPARKWDDEARIKLEEFIEDQKQQQLAKMQEEMDKLARVHIEEVNDEQQDDASCNVDSCAGRRGAKKPKRTHDLDDPEADIFMGLDEDSDDIQDPQEFLLLQEQIKQQKRLQEQIHRYHQSKIEYKQTKHKLHAFRANRRQQHRDSTCPYPPVRLPAGDEVEQAKGGMEEQVRGAVATSSSPEGKFPGFEGTDPSIDAAVSGRWIDTV